MKTLIITESQKEGIKRFLYEKSLDEKKVPSAQDQVHNKVNSGIMDVVTACGTMEEGAEPESDNYKIGFEDGSFSNFGHISESVNDRNFDFSTYMKSILEFMKNDGLHVYPFPKIKLNWEKQDGLFIKTGYYEPATKTIVVFCCDRNPKDILRTFTHECIHHSQNLDGKDLNFSSADDVKDNERLEKIEGEAYLKGNIYFRKWTEYHKGQEMLQESKNKKKDKQRINDNGEIVPKRCPCCGSKIMVTIQGEPIYKCSNKKCGKFFGVLPFSNGLNEDVLSELISPEEVDLSSFKLKNELNPKFWKNNHLDSRIRIKLLDIADDFINFLGIDWIKPEDVTITGSLANYNWNKKFSDIDLHIIVDFSKVDKRTDFVKKYFDAQRKLWNEEHEGLEIFGFPIEVYVQDKNEKHSSTGVYSLDKNKWLTEPDKDKLSDKHLDKEYIKKQVAHYVNIIDDLEEKYNSSNGDKYKSEQIYDKVDAIFDELKRGRTEGLKNANNEMTDENIIWKSLRRMRYIEKMMDLLNKTYSTINSLS